MGMMQDIAGAFIAIKGLQAIFQSLFPSANAQVRNLGESLKGLSGDAAKAAKNVASTPYQQVAANARAIDRATAGGQVLSDLEGDVPFAVDVETPKTAARRQRRKARRQRHAQPPDPSWAQKEGESEADWLARIAPKGMPTRAAATGGPLRGETQAQWLNRISPESMLPNRPFRGPPGVPPVVAGGGAAAASGALAAGMGIGAVIVGFAAAAAAARNFARETSEAMREFGKFNPASALAAAQQDFARIQMAWRRANAAEPFASSAIKSRTELERAWQPLMQLADKLGGMFSAGMNTIEAHLVEVVNNTFFIRQINSYIKWLGSRAGYKMADSQVETHLFQQIMGRLRDAPGARPIGESGQPGYGGYPKDGGNPRPPRPTGGNREQDKPPIPPNGWDMAGAGMAAGGALANPAAAVGGALGQAIGGAMGLGGKPPVPKPPRGQVPVPSGPGFDSNGMPINE